MEERPDFAAALAAINPWMPVDGANNQACFFCGARRRRDHFEECLWSRAANATYNEALPPPSFRAEDGSAHWYRD
jgi:hypothetical protein